MPNVGELVALDVALQQKWKEVIETKGEVCKLEHCEALKKQINAYIEFVATIVATGVSEEAIYCNFTERAYRVGELVALDVALQLVHDVRYYPTVSVFPDLLRSSSLIVSFNGFTA